MEQNTLNRIEAKLDLVISLLEKRKYTKQKPDEQLVDVVREFIESIEPCSMTATQVSIAATGKSDRRTIFAVGRALKFLGMNVRRSNGQRFIDLDRSKLDPVKP